MSRLGVGEARPTTTTTTRGRGTCCASSRGGVEEGPCFSSSARPARVVHSKSERLRGTPAGHRSSVPRTCVELGPLARVAHCPSPVQSSQGCPHSRPRRSRRSSSTCRGGCRRRPHRPPRRSCPCSLPLRWVTLRRGSSPASPMPCPLTRLFHQELPRLRNLLKATRSSTPRPTHEGSSSHSSKRPSQSRPPSSASQESSAPSSTWTTPSTTRATGPRPSFAAGWSTAPSNRSARRGGMGLRASTRASSRASLA